MGVLIWLICVSFSGFGQGDTTVQKPDLKNISFGDIRWAKSEGQSFWFFHKPTGYFFVSNEFETIPLENGDILAYLFEPGMYVLLPDYTLAIPKKEMEVEAITARSCVFIRNDKGGFRIYDKGLYVQGLIRVGINALHQYVYRNRVSDKRYWIEEQDFIFARIGLPVGILSE